MPLPEPSEQEGESMKAAQEPSPEPSMDVVLADPSEPQEFSNLVLLTAADQEGNEVGSDPTEVHCIISLEMADPSTLSSTLQILPAEGQVQAVQPHRWSSGLKRSKLETGETSELPLGPEVGL